MLVCFFTVDVLEFWDCLPKVQRWKKCLKAKTAEEHTCSPSTCMMRSTWQSLIKTSHFSATFYVPFWNLWASSVEFQKQDPKLHYNHWAFNEIPLLIRPTGSRQFPAAGSPIESWSVAAGYSDLLPDALFAQCTTFYTKALLLKIFTKHNFFMARDL